MLSALSADIYKNSSAAKECLERLPVSQENTDNIYKFLATAGDFSRAVAVSNNDEVTAQNKKQLKKLIDFSEKLSNEITQTAMLIMDMLRTAMPVTELWERICSTAQCTDIITITFRIISPIHSSRHMTGSLP